MKNSVIVFLIVSIIGLASIGTYLYVSLTPEKTNEEPQEDHISFILESYDKIKENYWGKITDEQLGNIYKLAAQKLTEQEQVLATNDRTGVQSLVENIFNTMEMEKRKDFTVSLVDTVLANLEPFGRSRLFTEKQGQALMNTVENINPDNDLYALLGITKETTREELEEAYQVKIAATTAEEKQKIDYAKEILADQDKKERYDETRAEPTTLAKLISPEVAYIKIDRFSSATFEEFAKDAQNFDQGEKLNSLILDLRDNIGGAIDLLPYFLGPFIGPDQYAYEFYHKGEKVPFKTKVGWLDSLLRYKKVVILVNENTQSSAEVMAATLKKYNVGIVMGTRTKGHGTIEKLIPMNQQISPDEKFSIFIVESLALRDDGQPIEKNGVEPHIDKSSNDWEKQLLGYFNYTPLIKALKQVW